jgi:hypothetical protein
MKVYIKREKKVVAQDGTKGNSDEAVANGGCVNEHVTRNHRAFLPM